MLSDPLAFNNVQRPQHPQFGMGFSPLHLPQAAHAMLCHAVPCLDRSRAMEDIIPTAKG